MTKLVSAAIKFRLKNSEYYHILCGRRHDEIFRLMHDLHIDYDKETAEQGFLTSDDKFVDRRIAVYVARAASQVSQDFNENILYSEDVWPENE